MSKTLQQKMLSGTQRRDRDKVSSIAQGVGKDQPAIDFEVLEDVPKAPNWMPNVHATKEWNRLAPILVKNKMLTSASLSAFGIMCATHGKIVQLLAAGESPPSSILSCHRTLINDFGLTPMAQGKIKVGVVDVPKGNPFANNGSKRRA